MKAPFCSKAMSGLPFLRDKFDRFVSCNLAEYQCAQHRHRIRRGAIKMSRGFSRRIKARYRPTLAQHFGSLVGRKTAKSVGDRPDQRIGEIWRLIDRARP